MCIRKMALWIVAVCLASAVALEAQPGGRRGGSGGGMGGGVSPEQIFSLLALEEKFNVKDKQLVALREVLKPLYVEQRQMMAEMFSSARRGGETDFRALREKMREQQSKMREQMMAALTAALDAEQIEALKAHLQQQQRQQQRQRGGPRGGGDGPQGGGF